MTGLRKRLRDGEVVFGQMVLELFTSGIGPMLASSGMEFVIYDMEHGRCDLALLAEMVASCRGSDIVPFIQGHAWITGETVLRFAPDDPFRWGIPEAAA